MTARPQHMQALELANQLRLERSKIRIEVHSLDNAAGRGLLADIIEQRPRCVHSIDVLPMLRWVNRMQVRLARRMLTLADCSEHKRVGELSDRQAAALGRMLRMTSQELAQAYEDWELEQWAFEAIAKRSWPGAGA